MIKTKNKPDYELKSNLINSGTYFKFKNSNYNIRSFLNKKIDYNEEIEKSYDYLRELRLLRPIDYLECNRISNSLFHRNCRVRSKIERILTNYDNLYFLTLTFTNDYLSRTSYITRRRQVARWLKSNCIEYVANIDYGTKNGREHYHAVCAFNDLVDYTSFIGGAVNSKPIINKNSYRLKNYINKLSLHAMKDTTKQVRLIYSRKVNN